MSPAVVLQWVGAAGILLAFALSQRELWRVDRSPYLVTNLVAAGCLCAAATLTRQWGFTLLEGAWAAIALRGLVLRVRS